MLLIGLLEQLQCLEAVAHIDLPESFGCKAFKSPAAMLHRSPMAVHASSL